MSTLQLIVALFAVQHGVISRSQALTCGLTRRQIEKRCARGLWIIVLPGVYRLAGAPVTWEQRLMAAVLWAGPDSVASFASAAALWELPDVVAGQVEVTSTRRLRSLPGMVVHYTRHLDPLDRGTVRGIPVTSPTRTLVDLATFNSRSHLGRCIDCFLVRRQLSVPFCWRELNRIGTRGRKHATVLRRSLLRRWRRDGDAESVTESDLHELLSDNGFEGWKAQVEIWDGGRFIARPDVVFESEKLVIEMLSWEHHGSRGQQRRDARRQNELERLGYTVLQFFWEDVVLDPEYILRQVRATLTRLHSRAARV